MLLLSALQWLQRLLRRLRGLPDPTPKRLSPGRRRLNAVLRYLQGFAIVGSSFGLAIFLLHDQILFILLPTGLYVVFWAIAMRSRIANRNAMLFTTAVSLAYFAIITGWQLLTHYTSTQIILITTTLAVAILLEPVRALVQSAGEQRFHLIDDRNARILDAFTAALREEIDLEQVRERFTRVVQEALQPGFLALWIREQAADTPMPEPPSDLPGSSTPTIAIEPGDPLLGYALAHPGLLELTRLPVESAAVRDLKAQEAELALPLIGQSEVIGLLALGARQDGEDYTRDDRRLLVSLAAQATPAIRVAQMVRTEATAVRRHERIEQELRTAQQIQRTFLPKEVPILAGWELVPHYQPAREVGGDFYDFLPLTGGSLGLVIGDVTGKGVPAALVMTATRTMLRTAAQEDPAPARVFARVNALLQADMPSGMFVTAFYALLDPASGYLRYANAGQDYPLLRHADGTIDELRATGMPLGLMPELAYDEHETALSAGDTVLFFSDGVVEAHNAAREMFGLARLKESVASRAGGDLIAGAMGALASFTGSATEQEDDITLVALSRRDDDMASAQSDPGGHGSWRTLDTFTVPSAPGNEREAAARVARAVGGLGLAQRRLEDLETAVAEATMNAMEHGYHYDPAGLVTLTVRATTAWLSVLVADRGDTPIPAPSASATPDLAAKLAGTQSPRGWGLFLIKNLVDEVRVTNEAGTHTIELLMRLPGETGTVGATS